MAGESYFVCVEGKSCSHCSRRNAGCVCVCVHDVRFVNIWHVRSVCMSQSVVCACNMVVQKHAGPMNVRT